MKRIIFLAAIAALTACNNGKTEQEIRKEIEAEIKHKEDSIRLAKAEARAKAAEEKAEKALIEAEKAKEKAIKADKKSASASPVSSKRYNGGNSDNPYAWLSEMYVSKSDLYGYSQEELCLMRNAIYARHGYSFKRNDLMQYFSQFSWYSPRYSNVESSLSAIEKANVQTIKSLE